jgi:hypothetical protein
MNPGHPPQIEEILINKHPAKKTTNLTTAKPRHSPHSHRWFHTKSKREKEKPSMTQKSSSDPLMKESDDIHKKIDAVIAKKETESKKPSY